MKIFLKKHLHNHNIETYLMYAAPPTPHSFTSHEPRPRPHPHLSHLHLYYNYVHIPLSNHGSKEMKPCIQTEELSKGERACVNFGEKVFMQKFPESHPVVDHFQGNFGKF